MAYDIDWGATSNAVQLHFDTTGTWGNLEDFYVYQGEAPVVVPPVVVPPVVVTPPPVVAPPVVHGEIDWTATAAATTAFFNTNGWWSNDPSLTVYKGGEAPVAPPVVVPPVATPVPPVVVPPVVTPPVEQPVEQPGDWQVQVHESFDNGLGLFSRAWGPGVDTSVDGQLTLWTSAQDIDSGAMMPPTGAQAGFGYGLYEFTLDTKGTVGIYALLWPGTDKWPGPELDILEIDYNGNGVATIHYDDNGGNGWAPYELVGVDVTQVHTYGLEWQAGQLTGYVDGQEIWTTGDNVPEDYAHGGENLTPGVGSQTWWNGGSLGGENFITIYDFTYSTIA